MTARLLEGKVFAAKLREEAGQKAAELKEKYGITPGLAVIIVGENPASQVYVRNKHKACTELGFYSEGVEMPETTTREELLAEIDRLNKDEKIHGILVQLPLPKALQPYESEVLEAIDPLKDVDGFHPVNVGRLVTGQKALVPCTPHGCLRMLELADIPIEGANAVVIGRSNIVGKPMAQLMLQKGYGNATVTVCHSQSRNLQAECRDADILIAAVGSPAFVTADMVKPGAVVIDVGTTRVPDSTRPKGFRLQGDVDFEHVAPLCSAITPVPGGVGPMTICMLMLNTLSAAKHEFYA